MKLQISDNKISGKSIMVFHFELSYACVEKIMWNLLIQYVYLHRETAL